MKPNTRRALDARDHLDEMVVAEDGLGVAIIDLLTNLRHLAALEGLNWDELSATAAYHQREESIHGEHKRKTGASSRTFCTE
jgi:hypothetical protein